MGRAGGELDQDLARAALAKRKAGRQPTVREAAALRRVEAAHEEELFRRVAERIPKKWWQEWSGRQAKVINEQAARYGIPFGGKTISLPAVVLALHDFLAANARKLAADDRPADTWQDKIKEEEFQTRRLRRLELEGSLVARSEIQAGLARFASHIRNAGEILARDFGPAALKTLTDALEDAQTEIDGLVIADGNPAE